MLKQRNTSSDRRPHPGKGGQDGEKHQAWHRRQASGEFGNYGNYGGSDDQWDIERQPTATPGDVPHYGVLPAATDHVQDRHFGPGYTLAPDIEPYRSERIYGNESGVSAEYAAYAGVQTQQADERYEARHPEARGASLTDQFGAYDESTHAGVDTWRTGLHRMAESGPRPDIRIHEDVCERLSTAAGIDVSQVSVRVSEAIVSLEGSVANQGMKHVIGNIAAHCAGVAGVENHIRVETGAGTEATGGLAVAADDSQLLNGRQT